MTSFEVGRRDVMFSEQHLGPVFYSIESIKKLIIIHRIVTT